MAVKLQEFHAESIFRYTLGGLFGLILGLLILHILHVLSGTEAIHTFLFHWVYYESPYHAQVIVAGFILAGIGLGLWVDSRRSLNTRKGEVKVLREINQTKTELISFASHEMRAPIAALRWSVKMILEGDFGDLPERQRDILSEADGLIQTLESLVNEFLDVSKIENEKMELFLKQINLKNLGEEIKNVINEFQAPIKNKQLFLDLKVFLDPNRFLLVDSKRVCQIVRNLLENAIDYTPAGGKIKIILESDKDKFKFQISDSGIGIPPEEQSKMFSKFFRAANAKRVQSTGTGLGLYLCKKFIEAHRGEIWFTSEENKGAIFNFIIPLRTTLSVEELFKRI